MHVLFSSSAHIPTSCAASRLIYSRLTRSVSTSEVVVVVAVIEAEVHMTVKSCEDVIRSQWDGPMVHFFSPFL